MLFIRGFNSFIVFSTPLMPTRLSHFLFMDHLTFFSTTIVHKQKALRSSPAVVYPCSSSLFVENKSKNPTPAVFYNNSSSSNFFTKCNQYFSFLTPRVYQPIFVPKISLSALCSLFSLSLLSLCSFGLLGFLLKHKTG